MKTAIAAALVLGAFVASAAAEQKYDKRLEAAAISNVARKMGDLRGGYGERERPVFVAPIDRSKPTHLSAKPEAQALEAEPAPSATRTSFVAF